MHHDIRFSGGSKGGLGRYSLFLLMLSVLLVITACGRVEGPTAELEPGEGGEVEVQALTPDLRFSASADRRNATLLDSAEVSGEIYVFVNRNGINQARFYLNDKAMQQRPLSTQTSAPFNMMGQNGSRATAFDTRDLDDGVHTLTVVTSGRGQRERATTATFVVNNRVEQDLREVIWISPNTDRTDAAPLGGSKVHGSAHIFVVLPDIRYVDFSLNGDFVRRERYGFFDFWATARDGSAYTFDLSTLEPGEHRIGARVVSTRGNVRDLSATFTVVDPASTSTPTDEPADEPADEPEETASEGETEATPASISTGRYSLRGNPNFSASRLTSEQRKWYDTLWRTINNPQQHPNALSFARRGDIYEYGRNVQNYVSSLLIAFRMTGDLRLLDQVDKVMELMRAQLSDSWRNTLDGTNGRKDGYLNWVDLHTPTKDHRGKDLQAAFDMRTHALVAYAAYAFQNNRDLRSPGGVNYGARADFWKGYLTNHFEAKWRKRFSKSSGFPFIPDTRLNATHTFISSARFHYYMGKLTGNSAYTREAERITGLLWKNEFKEASVSGGAAIVWRQGAISAGSKQNYLMSNNYARYVISEVVDFHFEGFSSFASTSNMQKFARSLSTFVMDSSSLTSFARDIGGGTSRAGFSASPTSWSRVSQYNLTEAMWPTLMAWDTTSNRELKAAFDRMFYSVEMQAYNQTPRRVFVPTGMLVNAFLR
jgi:hypothetical protein